MKIRKFEIGLTEGYYRAWPEALIIRNKKRTIDSYWVGNIDVGCYISAVNVEARPLVEKLIKELE